MLTCNRSDRVALIAIFFYMLALPGCGSGTRPELGEVQGTITIEVRVEDGTAILRVIDDGPGVPKEIRREIFQPGTSTKEGGWGIGLALARRVVEDNHHGNILLETAEHGAVFSVTLPVADQDTT